MFRRAQRNFGREQFLDEGQTAGQLQSDELVPRHKEDLLIAVDLVEGDHASAVLALDDADLVDDGPAVLEGVDHG